ncbi:unnamed protein product [Clavelina lepadiformis]|uniref:ADF-H domain-containing protein n=1 Tax=Clavelina lepadiformis TaxID=159417 RepID=A0ABP0EZL9_CLALP
MVGKDAKDELRKIQSTDYRFGCLKLKIHFEIGLIDVVSRLDQSIVSFEEMIRNCHHDECCWLVFRYKFTFRERAITCVVLFIWAPLQYNDQIRKAYTNAVYLIKRHAVPFVTIAHSRNQFTESDLIDLLTAEMESGEQR